VAVRVGRADVEGCGEVQVMEVVGVEREVVRAEEGLEGEREVACRCNAAQE
jgi:hypothetical protein